MSTTCCIVPPIQEKCSNIRVLCRVLGIGIMHILQLSTECGQIPRHVHFGVGG